MRIVQTVFGVFHHFALARELDRRGHLQRVYSTWPWARLRREGLPHQLVETYPWWHMAELAASRSRLPGLADHLGYANALAFDRWTLRRFQRFPQPPDALIAISGSSLATGQWLQQHGGVFICDRGSTHQRFQQDILSQEYALWGVDRPISDHRDTAREEAIYAQADAITVPSSIAMRSFLQMGVPAAKLHLIPYGVRLDAFHPTVPPDPDTFDVLFAGAAGLRKGVPYLLQAFANLQHPRKTLCIAGDLQPDLRGILSRLPTAGVKFLGPVPRTRLVDLMSRSHALVLPSIEDGFGLVLSEAMACGCPPIASTHTGGEDLFTDGVEGFLVPIRDPAAITARLQQLADSPALQRAMSAAALARVQSLGGWIDYGDRWESLLHTLTGK
jgi:glycosyltransferase involved in cell wall biosynthesis